jgi:polyhydroxyalkanoate synthesis regulator phasin
VNFSKIVLLAIIVSFAMSCKNKHAHDKHIKQLDSLKIVLQQTVVNFKTVDSLTCVNAFNKQYTYSQFLNTHLKDTVTKATAENLQIFYSIGKGLKTYLGHRASWLNKASLSINQLQDLSNDLKTGSIDGDEAIEFMGEEKKQAEAIINELKQNTEIIRNHLDQYNQSLPECESLIKKLNNGMLPEIIKTQIIYTSTAH